MMDLRLLRRFYIVAEEGTIGRAAKRMNVASSAVTKSIIDFEYQLKTRLFERVPKGMHLTQQGERLYAFAKKILEQTDSFEKSFHEKEDEISGEIKILTTPFVGCDWLVPNLKKFLEKHQKLKIKVLLRSENIDLTEGDVAILTKTPNQLHLIQKHLFTVQVKLFASPSYLKKFGMPEKIEDLDNHRLITYKGNYYSPYGSTNWALNLGGGDIKNIRESYFEIDSLHGMLNSALNGIGIAELPNYSSILNNELIEIFPNIIGPETPIYYIFPQIRKNSKKIQALFEYLSKKGK